MAQSVKWPELLGEACPLLDPVDSLLGAFPLLAFLPGENVFTLRPGVLRKQPVGGLVHRYPLVRPSLGVSQGNKAPVKVDVRPFQLEALAAPHAGVKDKAHHVGDLQVGIGIYGVYHALELIGCEIFRGLVINGGLLVLLAMNFLGKRGRP